MNGQEISFTMAGDVNETMRVVQRHPMESLDVERPSLDEIFLTFYGPGVSGGSR